MPKFTDQGGKMEKFIMEIDELIGSSNLKSVMCGLVGCGA
jgi:hypothetical protein